jgi:hypothetical protein
MKIDIVKVKIYDDPSDEAPIVCLSEYEIGDALFQIQKGQFEETVIYYDDELEGFVLEAYRRLEETRSLDEAVKCLGSLWRRYGKW